MAKHDVFRKVALDRLASPEQLDELMRVTTPKGWAAVASLAALLAAGLVWSVVGTLPERVGGQAILLRSGGVFEVVSRNEGRVTDVPVQSGDLITEGQVVARLAQPEVREQLRLARDQVGELEAQTRQIAALAQRDAALQAASLVQHRTNLDEAIRASEVSVANLRAQVEAQQRLVAQGLITRQALLGTQDQYEQARERVRASRSDLRQLEVQNAQAANQQQQQLLAARNQLLDARRKLAQLENDVAFESAIVTPYSGRVLEVMVEQGGVVDRGKPILTVSLVGKTVKHLEAVVYVPSVHGKKIHPGMDVEVVPATVKREEFGHLLGRVTYVSDFPATPEGMLRVLKNTTLVQALSGQDAPYEVHADLIPDAVNMSGYRWSSSHGPPIPINSGTLATANVVVGHRRPISMVIPQLRTDAPSGAARDSRADAGVARRGRT